MLFGMYNTPTNHDLAQVQNSLDNMWSGAVIFCSYSYIGWKWHGREELICGAIWSCGLSHFINQMKLHRWGKYAEWLQKHSTKPCSAKSRNNGNQYSIHLHLCMMHRLLFHETIINEAQVPPTGLLCEVQAGEMVTWKDFIMLPIMQQYESVLCSSSLHLLD